MTNPIVFLGDSDLAVSLSVRNPHPGLSVRGKVWGSPFLFTTIFLDSNTGKVLRRQTWSNLHLGLGIFPGPAGEFVVWHALDIDLRSADGLLLKTLALNPKDFPRTVALQASPTGETLLADGIALGTRILRIRTGDLKPMGWLTYAGFSTAPLDTGVAIFLAEPDALPGTLGVPMQLLLLPFAGGGHQRPTLILSTSAPGCDSVVALDRTTLGISGLCHDPTILDTSGRVLYRRHFKDVFTGALAPARRAGLVAFDTYALRGGSSWLDTFPHAVPREILILNWRNNKLVHLPDRNHAKYISALALSPNGCTLAVQRDWHLDIYRVCDSAIGTELGIPTTPSGTAERARPPTPLTE